MTDNISQTMQPTFVSVNKEILRRAIEVADACRENAAECLRVHRDNYFADGSKKDRFITQIYQQEMSDASKLADELRRLVFGTEQD